MPHSKLCFDGRQILTKFNNSLFLIKELWEKGVFLQICFGVFGVKTLEISTVNCENLQAWYIFITWFWAHL